MHENIISGRNDLCCPSNLQPQFREPPSVECMVSTLEVEGINSVRAPLWFYISAPPLAHNQLSHNE